MTPSDGQLPADGATIERDGGLADPPPALGDLSDRPEVVAGRLAAIVASSDDAIIGKTLDAIITSWNPGAERLYGYSAAEAIGRPVAMLVPPEREDELPRIMDRLRAGERLDAFDSVRMRRDGSRVDVSLRISPVHDGQGRIVAAAAIARDISQQARARDALRLLAEAGDQLGASLDYEATLAGVARLLVPRLADWCSLHVLDETDAPLEVALVHADPARVDWVRAMRERFPYDYEETSGLMRVLRGGEALIYPEFTDAMLVAGARSPEHLATLREAAFRSAMILPLTARGHTLGALTLVTAESGRLYDEADVALARELARRAALAVDNARLYREAQRLARAREEFLSIAAHELKTPLTTIKASAQLLARRAAQPDADARAIARLTEQVTGQVGRLEALVNDLLDLSRVEAGAPLRPAWVDLREVARAAFERCAASPDHTPRHALSFDAPEPVEGCWDAGRLDQVTTNLLSNALKYSPDGGAVALRVRRDGDWATLSVRDEGVGIPAASLEGLFQPFARGDAAERGIPGTGLGLYIAARIVEQHGGALTVASEPGAGSTFTVTLPLTPAAPD